MPSKEPAEAPARMPIFLAGPTATGKSAVAAALARRLDGEVVSVDSMQVYRGLDIGTAKPDPAERAAVPHHLIDIRGIEEGFDAAQFVAEARSALEQIRRRGKTAIFCGGTGLYFKAWLCGLGGGPPPDPGLRARLEGLDDEALRESLLALDSAAAATVDGRNRRRLIRAIEIVERTGRPLQSVRASWSRPAREGVVIAILREPQDLRQRILTRVDVMFQRGLIEETRALLERGLRANRTAMQAIGYRQVVAYLEGALSLPAARLEMERKTLLFARRQMSWLRRQLPVRWVRAAPAAAAAEIANEVLAATEMEDPAQGG